MRDTRYYTKKNDGNFFAKLPKDADDSIDDGRKYREWTFGNDQGRTLGFEVKELSGMVESAYIQKFDSGDKMFCVGLQHEQGVDVFQCDLMNKYGSLHDDVTAFALRYADIDLDFPVQLSVFIGKPKPSGFKPAYLNINQANKPVWPSFKRVSGHTFEGVPDAVKKEKFDGSVEYDTEERDAFLYSKLEELMKAVDAKGNKANRESTPAEAAAPTDGEEPPF